MPITYDIVVSDFGRDATIEYLSLLSAFEKQIIEKILHPTKRAFFDEYRRLMFVVVADLAFFKRAAIAASAVTDGYLTEDILIGLGPSPMAKDFVDGLTLAVAQQIIAAADRGRARIRVMIPCNGLSVAAKQIETTLHSAEEWKRILSTLGADPTRYKLPNHIKVHTVPDAVMKHLRLTRISAKATRILVLGTRGVNGIYSDLNASSFIEIVPLADWEYELIDRTIVASIGGDSQGVNFYRERLQRELIDPQVSRFADLIVLEACTDFRLNLGVRSIEVFANAMATACYETAGESSVPVEAVQ